MDNPATPVVFVHGLWIHSTSWQPWMDLFTEAGYAPAAPGWPGEAATVEATRRNGDAIKGTGIADVTAAYERHISTLSSKPIVVGHSFGGLIAQRLLASGHARAAVAIDPAGMKGVKKLPLVQLRSALPVLSKPSNKNRAVSLTPKQFAFGFGNRLTRHESDVLHARFAVPGPGRVLFEGAAANKTPDSPATIDFTAARGPLLMIAGGKDHTVPEAVVQAAFDLYAGASTVTDLVRFPDRAHSLVFDAGWREVAERSLAWLRSQGL
ncbi:alpha/beta hydrolase [Curtobacterium sp. MCBD17_030]|uniref:alpha/beta hydrolase n=1 Tax=Curtobacterium sp. MCBD17_030 TaxID=2175649 RepID=UPI000D8B1FD6|nr:alpha/beta hydrolase [Curtobacterium sp. MCBD17_030]PYY36425.1 alpha/beta hydrolase [Curtobacterium sp. MCBD17_030]